jgi:hypothetical protein
VPTEKLLQTIYGTLNEMAPTTSLRSLVSRWQQQSQADRRRFLEAFDQDRTIWIQRLAEERAAFHRVIWSGLAIIGLLGAAVLGLLVTSYHRIFGRRGVLVQLLETQSQMRSHLLPGPASPIHLSDGGCPPAFQKIDAIEAELINESDREAAVQTLKSFLGGEDPWVHARAAKALYKFDPKLGLEEIKALLGGADNAAKLPGLWAVELVGTPEAFDLLKPLAYSDDKQIQQAVVRCLIQLTAKRPVDPATFEMARQFLEELRAKTDWII